MIEGFYYTYVLCSEKDGQLYTGFTSNLDRRLQAHRAGEVSSTKYRRPMMLLYYEACLSKKDALHREKYLKRHYGKMFLKNRLKNYLTDRGKTDKIVLKEKQE